MHTINPRVLKNFIIILCQQLNSNTIYEYFYFLDRRATSVLITTIAFLSFNVILFYSKTYSYSEVRGKSDFLFIILDQFINILKIRIMKLPSLQEYGICVLAVTLFNCILSNVL